MPRYIDAEIMPHGPLWEQLTVNEKLNVLNYLLSSPSVDIAREIFSDIAANTVHLLGAPEDMLVTAKSEFIKLMEKYNVSREQCEKDTVQFLQQLMSSGLVLEAEA